MSSQEVQLTDKLEDYLEAVFVLMKDPSDSVRVRDISSFLGVNKATTVAALKKLKDACLITQEHYGQIHLTPEGSRYAQKIFSKHKIIKKFLTHSLQVDPETAEKEACLMEHILSEQTISKMRQFLPQ